MLITIQINKMRLHAHHGVLPQERLCGNDFEVSVTLQVEGYDGSDRLDSTVNYAAVAELIRREMNEPSQLLEHVAARISRSIGREFAAVRGGSVTVAKLTPPMRAEVERVSVTVTW